MTRSKPKSKSKPKLIRVELSSSAGGNSYNPWRVVSPVSVRTTDKPPRIGKACICLKRQEGREPLVELAWREDSGEGDGTWEWTCADGERAGSLYYDAWRYVGRFEGQEVQI